MRFAPALLLACALSARADTCAECSSDKLCARHTEEDKAAARSFQKEMGHPDPEARKAALEAFAANCRLHNNCQPPANAQILGIALKDSSPAVRAAAAKLMGEQHGPTAAKLLEKEVEPLVKRLGKEPKNEKEDLVWLADFDCLSAICEGLGILAVPEAGPAMVKVLDSNRLKVLTVAAKHLVTIRSKVLVPALIAAIDRVRTTGPGADGRDAAYLGLMTAWEKLTNSGVKLPAPGDVSEASRFVADCKAWWKANEKTWK
ncbi:MAG: HEAT repeat domain-containing protein [Planctomycetes bacterium]|nr:HEAT repeat domain-containing protein [Planctomycetota bacterium]